MADLEQSYQRMWKFYVLALTKDEQVLAKLGEIAAEFFPGTTNVLTPGRPETGSLLLGNSRA